MSTATPLGGKVALVTGSSRGIGAGIARELALRGAAVVINYRSNASTAQELTDDITAKGGKAISIRADVSNPHEIQTLFQEVQARLGQIDIVVSNSGVEHFGKLGEVTPEQFDRVFSVNTRGQFFVAQAASQHLSDHGRLILTSSISAHVSLAEHAVYAGSKCAVEAFARCFAPELGPRGITVNSVAPGGVKTDMAAEVGYKYIPGADASWTIDDIEAFVSARTPMRRMGVPTDIAKVVAFLATEDAQWLSGQNITISGGASA
ncbi:hypothetical protein ABOM_003995 [Aspergillus bombycis]|uniref:Ketoreductase domain-containing protein n=1 Tax=Aspergillus bombycis TaxID=109264 RepID=A0A1F8A773_9EURO|nr:hypothetical protein ABOM_003995 [Aspergillus bombycis]OGM47205.1 hypothetical protein ABOM_003995 [Aspergillus bombycis]